MVIIPPALNQGDTIGIFAPAGLPNDPRVYAQGCDIINQMGFVVADPDYSWPGHGYLADLDERRLAEVHRLWANQEIKALFALRGGYGCMRLLADLDLNLVQKNPKFLVGFSDITTLHARINETTGLISLHGPVLTSLSTTSNRCLERLYYCLTGSWHTSLYESVEVVREGPIVSGTLKGGNLASLVSLLGTPFFPELNSCILLLEDVNEPMYRLDRMLTQLALNGGLNQVNGIILGDFGGSEASDSVEQSRLAEFVWQRVIELTRSSEMPIWGKFPCGHISDNLTLPIGAWVAMDSQKRKLEFRCERQGN